MDWEKVCQYTLHKDASVPQDTYDDVVMRARRQKEAPLGELTDRVLESEDFLEVLESDNAPLEVL